MEVVWHQHSNVSTASVGRFEIEVWPVRETWYWIVFSNHQAYLQGVAFTCDAAKRDALLTLPKQ